MNPRYTPLGPGIVLILALITGGWFLQRGVAQDRNVYVQSRLLEEVVDHIAERFVEPVDRATLYDSAIEGLIRGLDDPNTSLLGAEAYENFRIQTEGDYGGVGLEIVDRDEYITIVSPIPGTPGAEAGIRAGDEIVEVEGESTEGWTAQQAVQVLRGRPGTDARVRIRRPGVEEPIDFTLTRERVQIRSVPHYAHLDGGVGYIPLNLFSETSAAEVRDAMDALESDGARSLILDLRGNPGGVLHEGIAVADLFLDRGVPVAETRGQAENQAEELRTTTADHFDGLPLVVLVDQGSASASEIVAGALQDHDRALVVGVPSFGKGSVQTLFTLTGGNVLKLTTARWYTPRGRSIERQEGPEGAAERVVSLTVDGEYAPVPDTAGRPRVASYGGRDLLGGGGIVPDLLVLPDTLSTEEQGAVRTLYREAGIMSTAIFDFAVDYLQRNDSDPIDFTVGPGEIERFFEELEARGLEADAEVRAGAERYVRRRLEGQIARQAGGEEARFLRQAAGDLPVQRAIELLSGAEDPVDLFARAGTALPSSSTGTNEPAGVEGGGR